MTGRAALARHPLSIAGALLTTAAAVVFVALAAASVAGLFDNPYAGLVIFVALPAIFLAGLLLIPLGMWLSRRRLKRDPSAVAAWPVVDFRRPSVRRTAFVVAVLTAANVVILLVAGYGSLQWMETPSFCGQTCHTPMHPQFTAWQQTSHSRVACVTCHIGQGGSAFVQYKLAGARQLMHVLANSFPRPIPPGAATMRPALEVCGTCHNPATSFGERLRVSHEYADDESNTETRTVLRMQVGGPGRPTAAGRAIHWHADPAVRIEFIATDADRQTIPYIKVTRADGRTTEYVAEGTPAGSVPAGRHRVMDCVDCHNATGHRIAPTAESAVDHAMASGRLARRLPFVRREAVRLLKSEHASDRAALEAIRDELRAFYAIHTSSPRAAVTAAVAAVQDVYRGNVFPMMKVTWGVYPDNVGHLTSAGCFRCHDGTHAARDGSTISGDCEYCHVQVEDPPVPIAAVPSEN